MSSRIPWWRRDSSEQWRRAIYGTVCTNSKGSCIKRCCFKIYDNGNQRRAWCRYSLNEYFIFKRCNLFLVIGSFDRRNSSTISCSSGTYTFFPLNSLQVQYPCWVLKHIRLWILLLHELCCHPWGLSIILQNFGSLKWSFYSVGYSIAPLGDLITYSVDPNP